MTEPVTMSINDVEYIRKDSVPAMPVGNRAVVVLDRGWIFAGDVTRKNGRIRLDRAVNVLKWNGGQGFDGMIADPDTDVVIKKLTAPVDIPEGAEMFMIPVGEAWGL